MNRKTTRVLFVALGGLLTLLLTLLMVNVTSASINAVAAGAVTIDGTLTLPGGALPLPSGTAALLLNPDRSVRGQSTVDANTGSFSFAGLTSGTYLIRGEPPSGMLNLASSPVVPVHVLTSNIILPPLALTHPSVTGTVYAPDGITPANAWVNVFANHRLVEKRLTQAGQFAIGGLPTGTYQLQAEPLPDQPFWFSRMISVALQPSASQFVTTTLRPVQIAGVTKAGASPIEGARVHAVTIHGEHRFDVTGPQGKFALGDLPLQEVTSLKVEPPIDRGGLLPPPIKVITTPDLNVALFFGVPDKIVRGVVKTNVNVPVLNAAIEAHRVDALGRDMTLSDARGAYTLTLSPGLWTVDVRPISTTVPAHWLEPNPPRLVQFDDTPLPERKIVNFVVLTADATVDGSVQLPGGDAPPFTVTVALHNDEGLGLAQPIDPSGHFSFLVPHGVYNLDLRLASPLFAAPPLPPVHARPLTTTDLPPITLIPRDAIITGTLTDEASNPVEDVPIIAWNRTTHASFSTRSATDGVYVMNVYSGTWFVRPAPLPDQPYVFDGDPANVAVSAHSVTPGIDFTLLNADATIHGLLLDPGGLPATSAYGFATARNADAPNGVHNGAPIRSGEFDILVPAGTYTVAINLPAGQPFMWDGDPQAAAVTAGDTTTVTFTLVAKNALIRGVAYDKRTDVSVNIDGRVWARDDELWVGTDLKAGGYYTLPVPAGLWRVNYDIDPLADYLKAAGPRSYALQAGQVQNVGLPLLRKDGLLTGTVVLTDGVTPARGAIVIVEGLSPELKGIVLQSPVRDDGRFTMQLPSGLWNVHSSHRFDPRLINPAARGVLIPRNGANSVFLQYRSPNAAIAGALSLSGAGPLTGTVHLFGWSSDDAFNTTIAPLNGSYMLPVISGRPWNIVAVFETHNQYWIARAQVPVPGPSAVKNLVLQGPHLKPAPVSVLIDPAEDRRIELSDGTHLFIPAGALPTDERVILHITPLAAVPHLRNGDVLGLGYAFEAYAECGEPITDQFNLDVVITFQYNSRELIARGLNINRLKPAYFSTTTNSWTLPDSYVVDEDRNTITMQINHFTLFSLVSEEVGNQVLLPMVIR
jgi:hypothetical protein